MTKIEQILDETSKNHLDSDLKNAASKMLIKCATYKNLMSSFSNFVSTLLDPKTKLKYMPKFIAKEDYNEKFKSLYKSYGWPSQRANVYDFSKDDMETQPYSVCMHNEMRKEAYEYPDLSRDEFIDYSKEPVAPASTNILDWWAKNSDFYPTLSLIA
ncbi:unnamed protein product [Gordionus sp. m RMFG-2023]